MPYSINIATTGQSLKFSNPLSTANVTIEIDFATEISPISGVGYVFDGRLGASNAYWQIDSEGKIKFDAAEIAALKINGVTQSWTSSVTPFAGSGLDNVAGKTVSVTLSNNTTSNPGGFSVMGKGSVATNTLSGQVSAVRVLIGATVVANYELEEGTGSALVDTTGTYSNGLIRNYVDDTVWVSTGGGSDTTPDAFSFTDQTDVAVSTLTTSNTLTITGMDAGTAISVSGGEMSINSGAFTSTATTIDPSDTVALRVTSSASNSTATNVTLTIGTESDIWTVTTVAGAGDTTPDAFSFTDQTDVAVSTLTTSNTVTITGIDTATAISVTGGEMSINSGAFTSSSTTVSVNDTVQLRVTSSASNSTAVAVTLDVGGVTDEWTVTTIAAAATGTITTLPFKNNAGTLQTGLSGLRVVALEFPGGGTALNSAGNTTHATTAVLTLSDAALTTGNYYGVVTISSDGTVLGIERIQAT